MAPLMLSEHEAGIETDRPLVCHLHGEEHHKGPGSYKKSDASIEERAPTES